MMSLLNIICALLLVVPNISCVSSLQDTGASFLTRTASPQHVKDTRSNYCKRASPRIFVLPDDSYSGGSNDQKDLERESDAIGDNVGSTRRRSFLGIIISTPTILASLFGGQHPAQAAVKGAKGAAEYDLEYYLRDLTKGNKKEGNLPASAPPPAPPARMLKGSLLPILLDDDFSDGCVPVKALANISGKSATQIAALANDYRTKSSKAFASKAQWQVESVKDQYYFDLSTYALWRAAADLIPDYVKRDKFARDVGRGIYGEAKKAGMLKKKALMAEADSSDDEDSSDDSSDDEVDGAKKKMLGKLGPNKTGKKDDSSDNSSDDSSDDAPLGPLTGTIPAIMEVLNLYNSSDFISSYRLGGEDASRRGKNVFDSLDDDDLKDGSTVDCLVSIYEPAILSAALQITGEGSRFSPDFVGSTLAAVWEEAGIKASYEMFFVDPVYRPNPKDFFPTERLIQITLKKAGSK